MRLFYFLLLTSFFLCSTLYSQTPIVEWQKCYGGSHGDYAHAIKPTSDGGYIMAGYAESPDGDITNPKGTIDVWVVKINATGDIQWKKNFGGKSWDRATSIHQLTDGSYILSGSALSVDGDLAGKSSLSMDFWLVKLTQDGTIEWQKSYGGSKADYAYDMQIAKDGGYIIVGNSESNDGDVGRNYGEYDVWIVKVSKSGMLEWKKSLGGSKQDEAWGVALTSDGGYIITGETASSDFDVSGNHGNSDLWLIKLNATGNTEWTKCLGGTRFEGGQDIRQLPNGNFIIGGYTGSNDGDVSGNHTMVAEGFADFWVVNLKSDGTILWQKCFGGGFNERAYALELTRDGGFVVAGTSESTNGDVTCNGGLTDYWVIKLSSMGTLEWQKSMGGRNYDEGYAITQALDGGYIVTGFTASSEIPGYHQIIGDTGGDFWTIKLSAQLYEDASPEISIAIPSTNICAGSPYTFTATAKAAGVSAIFQWKVNDVNVGTNSPSYSTNFIRAGDVVKCVMTVTTDCGNRTTQIESNTIVMQGGQDITPEVVVTASETSICNGSSVTFTAVNKSGNLNPSFQWSVNGAAVGTNSTSFITSSLPNGAVVTCRMTVPQCGGGSTKDDSDPITIIVKPVLNPNISIETASTTICKGTTAVFTARLKDGGTSPSLTWFVNGAKAGAGEMTFLSDDLQNGDIITCRLTPDFNAACGTASVITSNAIMVTVMDVPPATITIHPSDQNVCEGTLVSFSANTLNAGSGPSFQWKLNGNNTGYNTPAFSSNNLKQGDNISCELRVQNACSAGSTYVSNTIIIQVRPTVQINVHPADTTIMAGEKLQLNATLSGPVASFKWYPENYLQNPLLLQPYTVPLTKSVDLKIEAISTNGCKTEKEVKIAVLTKLFMPNSFTPNGDGLNDLFRIPQNTSLQLKEFSVFDRWGNKVFTTKDIRKGWNGTNKGQPLKTDTFVYIIQGNSQNEEIFSKGTVLLIR